MMMAMSFVVASAALPRMASLSLLSSARTSFRFPSPRVPHLTSSFISPSTSISFTSSSLSGLSLGNGFSHRVIVKERRRVVRVSARKYQLGQTKRSRSRKSLARTHGFRRRMRTTGGRAVLKRRRAKGRRVLCPKSYPRSGKFS